MKRRVAHRAHALGLWLICTLNSVSDGLTKKPRVHRVPCVIRRVVPPSL